MKTEHSEVLIPTSGKLANSNSNYVILKAFLGCAVIVAFGLTVLRYENKISEIEVRLASLEIQDIQRENQNLMAQSPVTRTKREVTPPWVKRTGEGDPFVNKAYLDFLRTQSQRARENDDYEVIHEESRGTSRLRSDGMSRQRGSMRSRNEPEITRNHADETFFTKDKTGNYIRPSGLKEMYERLPPLSSEVADETPNLETRSAGAVQGSRAAMQYAPVQPLGSGANRVRARVVRYDDSDSKTVAVAAHFVADVSNFTANENPRLRNSNGIFQIWRPADWMNAEDFVLDKLEGSVTVRKGGIYHIYSQIHYHDEQENSFFVEVNEVPLLQCTTTQQSNSCFTGGITHLKSNDKIVIKNVGVDRFSIYKPEKSFFGMMRIGDTPL